MISGDDDVITLTRSFSLYFVMSPEVHASGQPAAVGGASVPVQCPTTDHACFQSVDLESRSSGGLNATWLQNRLLGQLVHSNTIIPLETIPWLIMNSVSITDLSRAATNEGQCHKYRALSRCLADNASGRRLWSSWYGCRAG